ncbi:unnamed protein product [Adineta ricciae]|uniref:Uncharacterized protein n=1 Tax=Adineta ricciae TaxID=249248 RepID=A0A813Y157_ADIRI|nr:unnamed protein product [Adineta ricciae]CAF1105044.1 unnamed protein product [Adineta ricciae]
MARSASRGDLKKIYQYSENITKTRDRAIRLTCIDQNRGVPTDKKRSNRMARLRIRINRLTLKRQDEILKVYSNLIIRRNILSPEPRRSKQTHQTSQASISSLDRQSAVRHESSSPPSSPTLTSPRSTSSSPALQLIVANIDINPDVTKVDMIPNVLNSDNESYDDDDDDNEDDGIVYPDGVTDFRPYKTVARYRKATGKSTNFRSYPILVGEDSLETLILGLEDFAQQHYCDLRFTDEDIQFHRSVYRASCGLVDLGSIHLLATDSLLTATFEFEMDLDYDTDIVSSKENVETFVLDFCQAISNVLSCDINNVRVFTIEKLTKKSRKTRVNFGLTTSEHEQTQQLADQLKIHAQSGFSDEEILKHVKPRDYIYLWKTVLTHLKIRLADLDPQYNFDYRKPGVPDKDTRGGYPYFLPIGWFRHGLNVSTKYGHDRTWIGCVNAPGEWPVAFHGTHKEAVTGIVANGLLPKFTETDVKLDEAIDQIGEEANKAGLYVATHCHGGADLYTTPFTVTTAADRSEQFRIVFQCRVEPKKFTTHTSPVNEGEAWRFVDPNAIRPYGILLKKD